MNNTMATESTLNILTAKATAFRTWAELLTACARGYVPTLVVHSGHTPQAASYVRRLRQELAARRVSMFPVAVW